MKYLPATQILRQQMFFLTICLAFLIEFIISLACLIFCLNNIPWTMKKFHKEYLYWYKPHTRHTEVNSTDKKLVTSEPHGCGWTNAWLNRGHCLCLTDIS